MDFKVIFTDTLNSMDNLIYSLKSRAHSCDVSIDTMDEFWSEMVLGSKVLSHEATKFAIAHSTPPYDSDCCKDLSNSLVNAAKNLVETYFTLPSSVGSTFLQVISRELILLLSSSKEFIESVQQIVLDKKQVQTCLITTGILWEFCDRIPSLPRNNFDAVVKALHKEEQLVCDALHELEQARLVYNEGENSDSEDETMIQGIGIAILPSVKGLLKATISCLRKTKTLLRKPPKCNPTQLDPLVKELSNLSDCVDEIVCSTYSPVNIQQLLDKANLLASHLHKILETLKTGISGENEQQWIEFLGVAVEHNLQNLQMKVHVQP